MIRRLMFFVAIVFVSSCGYSGDAKQLGSDAANSGRFAEAYRLWVPLAEDGDAEVQEALALLLSGDGDVGLVLTRTERERMAARWVIRSALAGNKSAMRWLGQSLQNGWLGMVRNEKEASCWLDAGASKHGANLCGVPDLK